MEMGSAWKSIFLATTLRSSGTLWGGSRAQYELSHEDEWAGGGEDEDWIDNPDATDPLLSWGKAIFSKKSFRKSFSQGMKI